MRDFWTGVVIVTWLIVAIPLFRTLHLQYTLEERRFALPALLVGLQILGGVIAWLIS